MIDNFELIKPLFYFNEANNMFFHCQIVQRAKDHKPNKVKEGAINTYLIRSMEHLDRLKDEIVLLCEHYGARAYINVAGKDFDDVNKHMLLTLSNAVCTGNSINMNPRRILNSVAGEVKSRIPKWIIDIDNIHNKESVLKWLDNYYQVDNPPHYYHRDYFIIADIPTVQGCHLIVKPFNLQEFYKEFSDIDVHKNNGTLLYYPNSLKLPKYCCSVCGGTNIQLQAWIDPNNNNKYIEDTEDDECWCEDCQEHTKIKKINE